MTTTTHPTANRTRSAKCLTLLSFLCLLAPFTASAQLTTNELALANAGLLQQISADTVPPDAPYLSWQFPAQAVLPGNVLLSFGISCDLYDLGNGRVLIDDR